ncbi:MAG: response regulator [Solirubrobacteraceae bacterium]
MIRVFVVDDHPVLRAGLEAVLRAEPGFTCVGTAADGAEMRRKLARARPQVVVLDRRLGDEDGLDVCAALRAEPGAPTVVFYTAARASTLRPKALAAGAHAVVEKAADIDGLFDAIRLAARARAKA